MVGDVGVGTTKLTTFVLDVKGQQGLIFNDQNAAVRQGDGRLGHRRISQGNIDYASRWPMDQKIKGLGKNYTKPSSSRCVWRDPFDGMVMSAKITVLVVEDETMLRIDTVHELTGHGFKVMEAASASEAIAIFKSGRRFECMFTDVDMPGDVDGLELAQLVKDAWPPIEIIVTSGHRDVQPGDLPQDGLFVGKPYSTDAIAELIARLTGDVA